MAAELRPELLRALEPEVPVDDREDDGVGPARGLPGDGVLAGGIPGRFGRQLHELLGLRDGRERPAKEPGQRRRNRLAAELEERGSRSGRAPERAARGSGTCRRSAVSGLADAAPGASAPSARAPRGPSGGAACAPRRASGTRRAPLRGSESACPSRAPASPSRARMDDARGLASSCSRGPRPRPSETRSLRRARG